MPEFERAKPLPEGLTVGSPISQHHGIRCCPAVSKDSSQEYFLKLVPIPVNQDQAQALLLSGACATEADVDTYYQNQCDALLREVWLLQELHDQHHGFLPFIAWQANKRAKGVGFQVSLLSQRRCGLDISLLSVHQALDLAADLCDALSMCREAGYLYVNLKPSNIFQKANGKWCIGDLGFVSTDSLSYLSLPEKFRSAYTAPEISDACSLISPNADIYSLGMLLYQIFNGNCLPDDRSVLSAPQYADYILWGIIEKACHPDPAQRWQSPDALKQAIYQYRKDYGVADGPIVPPPPEAELEISHKTFLSEEENEVILADLWDTVADEAAPSDTVAHLVNDSLPTEDDAADDEDVSAMMAQIDDLLQHQPPQPVVAPVAYEINLPQEEAQEMPATEPEPEPIPEYPPVSQPQIRTEDDQPDELPADDEIPAPVASPKSNNRRIITIIAVIALVLALLIGGGIIYYNNFYTQIINGLSVSVLDNSVTVRLDTEAPDTVLRVVCADSYGNAFRSNVIDGKATISGLNPGTQYELSVEISGFHRLTGQTRTMITTASRTQMLNLSAVCGDLDGSVFISFATDGAPCNIWTLHYNAVGQSEQTISFSGTNVTVTGLTVGQTYQFRITAHGGSVLTGINEIQYTAVAVIKAENLTATVKDNGTVSVQWSTNGSLGTVWQIRCYNTDGYDKTYTTTQTNFELIELDFAREYTVLVTAEGNTHSEMIHISVTPDAPSQDPEA